MAAPAVVPPSTANTRAGLTAAHLQATAEHVARVSDELSRVRQRLRAAAKLGEDEDSDQARSCPTDHLGSLLSSLLKAEQALADGWVDADGDPIVATPKASTAQALPRVATAAMGR